MNLFIQVGNTLLRPNKSLSVEKCPLDGHFIFESEYEYHNSINSIIVITL